MSIKKVCFYNSGLLDLHAITTFGASVKEGKSPIGKFGTGLKYAIAVILRNDCQITVHTGERILSFDTVDQPIRGKTFKLVMMYEAGQPPTSCGFTTELGKEWELWMAYRELACNAKDEDGFVTLKEGSFIKEMTGEEKTLIIVQGAPMEKIYADRQDYILEQPAKLVLKGIEVRPGNHSKKIFYRTIAVGQLERPSFFTYNVTEELDLTEDRTIKYAFMFDHYLRSAITTCTDVAFLEEFLLLGKDYAEGHLNLDSTSNDCSPEFLETTLRVFDLHGTKVNESALLCARRVSKKEFSPTPAEVSAVQRKMIEKAVSFCHKIGYPVDFYPILIAEQLGTSTLALALDNKIYVAKEVLETGGTKMLASTLIEEYIHLHFSLADESRRMQQHLFDKIISMGEEAQGEPL